VCKNGVTVRATCGGECVSDKKKIGPIIIFENKEYLT